MKKLKRLQKFQKRVLNFQFLIKIQNLINIHYLVKIQTSVNTVLIMIKILLRIIIKMLVLYYIFSFLIII